MHLRLLVWPWLAAARLVQRVERQWFEDAGLTQALPEGEFESRIPARLLDDKRQWVGLARRVRGVAYDPERISPDQVDEWQDLADPSLEGEICVRSSTNIYNLSLMGEMIERWGADEAQAWAEGVVANMARAPQGGDTDQIEAVAAGLCGVAITNHYYWVRMTQGSPAQRKSVEKTMLSFPQQDSWGAHVNVTGAGVAAHAPHKEAAIQFLEWLTSEEGQFLLTTETKEIPLVPGAEQPAGLDRLPPEFKESVFPLNTLGENQAEAQAIYDRAGWN